MDLLLPAPTATRWLLLGDLVCLVALGAAVRRPLVGVPVALVAGFVALNLLSMAVTDFYLGLALFHPVVGVTVAAVPGRTRWTGLALLAGAALLGVVA